MVDRVKSETRSHIMAKVRSKNTKPELGLRKALFRFGFRYRLHAKELPGKPDLMLSRYRAVVFVNGCFWHWHGCNKSRMPLHNAEYWADKITQNKKRDIANQERLLATGWRVLIVWECALSREKVDVTVTKVADWLNSDSRFSVIP